MKLCAIYNVWDDYDWLYLSTERMRPLVDGIIIIASEYSNYGEWSPIPFWGRDIVFEYTVPKGNDARTNETQKRNMGLSQAKRLGYTHFLIMDADEVYEPESFLNEKERFRNPNLLGLVCGLKCFFKLPTLTVPDRTLVPFIHKLTPTIECEFNRKYPFAWIDGQIRIDPTRSLNINSGVEWSEIVMFHYSWCRSDVRKKIRNSTARQNIEQSTIVEDYINAKPGYFCEFYKAKLEVCENVFNLPEIIDYAICTDIQT